MQRTILFLSVLSFGLMPATLCAQPKNPKHLLRAGKVSLLKLPRTKGKNLNVAGMKLLAFTPKYAKPSTEDRHSTYPSQALSFVPSSQAPKKPF